MPVPSLVPNMRSYQGTPTKPLKPSRIWGFDVAVPPVDQRAGMQGMYHPILQAIAPPGCDARGLRLPIGIIGQISVDFLVGGVAIGMALVSLAVGQSHIAMAYLREHMPQVTLFWSVSLVAVSMGAGVGVAIHLMG